MQAKGNVMEISSSTQNSPAQTETDPMKKAIEVQKQQIEKIIDSATKQAKEVNAQKTGIGNNLNILG
jgi:hypothetical protein